MSYVVSLQKKKIANKTKQRTKKGKDAFLFVQKD